MNSRIALLALVVALARVSAQGPSVETLLERASTYVADFQKQLSGIVAEEEYRQDIKNSGSGPRTNFVTQRRLRSDLLLVRPVGADRYVEFRDVFEVDGRMVRDRDERLSKLFLDPPPGARSQLERVVAESSRYNIGSVVRTLNTPLLPLAFLLPAYSSSFRFQVRERKADTVVLGYSETARPTLIRTTRGLDLPARGRFWINVETGAIERSELVAQDLQINATITVVYRLDATLSFRVPAEMKEVYVTRGERIEGIASYGRFRKFQVNVDEAIKPIKQP